MKSNTEARQKILEQITQVEVGIKEYDAELKSILSNERKNEVFEARQKLKLQKISLEGTLDRLLPITIEGFIGVDEEQVDQDEHGTVYDIYYFLGCPNFEKGYIRKVIYDRLQDITEILNTNEGKLLRITIEELELGDGKKCQTCSNRFKCLTTRNSRLQK